MAFALVSDNTIKRLKVLGRMFGNTDKSYKLPHISFLEGLPVELLQSIASYLPFSAASLSGKYICYVLGRQYWHRLQSEPLEYDMFLGFLEKDMATHWLCPQ